MGGKSFNSFFFIQPCMTTQKPRGLHFFISGYATVVELPTSGLHWRECRLGHASNLHLFTKLWWWQCIRDRVSVETRFCWHRDTNQCPRCLTKGYRSDCSEQVVFSIDFCLEFSQDKINLVQFAISQSVKSSSFAKERKTKI